MSVVILETDRLILRPFTMADSGDMHRMAGAKEVADATSEMPYPLDYYEARDWVAYMMREHEKGTQAVFVMALKKTKEMIGNVELILEKEGTDLWQPSTMIRIK